jgi:hypothetical protein
MEEFMRHPEKSLVARLFVFILTVYALLPKAFGKLLFLMRSPPK